MYLGWIRAGFVGATLVSLAFVGPSFVMVLALAILYVRFEGLSWMQGAFYGIGAAVIAILVRSIVKLIRLAVGTDWLRWFIFAASALVTAVTESEVVWVFLLGGIVSLVVRAPPRWPKRTTSLLLIPELAWLTAGLYGPASSGTLWTILWYFAEAGRSSLAVGWRLSPFCTREWSSATSGSTTDNSLMRWPWP
jgi:chromate transporter